MKMMMVVVMMMVVMNHVTYWCWASISRSTGCWVGRVKKLRSIKRSTRS
jgi:hypothetical protein